MKLNLFKKKSSDNASPVVQTGVQTKSHPFWELDRYTPLANQEYGLYSALREAVPIIDAALDKIVRLVGGFKIECSNKSVERNINSFLENVRSGGCNVGINSFLAVHLSQLLTYGTAVGEIVLSGDGRNIYSLYNSPLKNIELAYAPNGVDTVVCLSGTGSEKKVLPYQNLILLSALNPEPGHPEGTSVLKGLPFVSGILLKIYNSIGVNWERVGNVRFAVTYKPSGDNDRAMSRQRAEQIAREWSKAMRDGNKVSDFVSVGDISIKVIGADNQILDSEIPVRQLLEQIVAKLSVPPFLLGLSWSTTERMSSQQADILTSELEYYRGILNGVITRICDMWLQLHGVDVPYKIEWENINLQDEVALAQARLYNAQAAEIEKGQEVGKNE